jgi:hypothetical protein
MFYLIFWKTFVTFHCIITKKSVSGWHIFTGCLRGDGVCMDNWDIIQ